MKEMNLIWDMKVIILKSQQLQTSPSAKRPAEADMGPSLSQCWSLLQKCIAAVAIAPSPSSWLERSSSGVLLAVGLLWIWGGVWHSKPIQTLKLPDIALSACFPPSKGKVLEMLPHLKRTHFDGRFRGCLFVLLGRFLNRKGKKRLFSHDLKFNLWGHIIKKS